MPTTNTTKPVIAALWLGFAFLSLTAAASAQGADSGGASGAANTAARGTAQVQGSISDFTKAGVAGTGMGGTSPGFQGDTSNVASGTGQSAQRPNTGAPAPAQP